MLNYPIINTEEELQNAIKANYCAILNNNGYTDGFKNFIATSSKDIKLSTFEDLNVQVDNCNSPLFGHLSYDLKNQIYGIESKNIDHLNWDNLMFFEAEHVIDQIEIPTIEIDALSINLKSPQPEITRSEYINSVKKIQELILDGEVYELNYCIPFTHKDVSLDPYNLYQRLNGISKMPFSAYFKFKNKHIICASPERFIKKEGSNLISQPMKGTMKRSSDLKIDQQYKNELSNSEKEKAENLMIVDLVRHDFKKSCKTGSIKVEDLFQIKSYPHVHQMISSIKGTTLDDINSAQVIKNCFPMGSMTGAPKLRALELIEQFETTKRGPFSGSLGYITPKGDFDFNVLIRSIFYDSDTQNLTYQVGSAITIDSDPEQEYDECMLKAQSIFRVLSNQQ